MKRCRIGAVEEDGKPVPFGILRKVFVGDGVCFFSQSSTENFSTAEAIAAFTSLHAFWRSAADRNCLVGIGEIGLIEFRV